MFVRYLIASGHRCLSCLMLIPSGPVELLFVLFEMANWTNVVVSRISSVGRFLIVWFICVVIFLCYTVCSDVCELFIKCFCFVYVSDGCFSSKANASVLLCKLFLLDTLLWCPTGSVDCVFDQFCEDVVSKCLFCDYVFVCLCDSFECNDLWV